MVMRIFALGLAVLVVGGPAWAADVRMQDWTFDKDTPGNPPSGFVIGKTNGRDGRWEVTTDTKAISAPHVLSRIPVDKQSSAPQVIFLDGIEAANLDLTVRIKALSSGDGQGGGVVFRAEDDRNYYVVWLSPQEKLVRLDRVVNGEVKSLQDLNVDTLEVGKWHALRLTIRGAEMEAIFDNRQFISAREKAWEFGRYKKGKLGLWARGPGVTYFDNVRFTTMDEATGSAPLGGTETTIIK
ncbi:MAG TPA: hypothetical protein VF879_00460 [Nitrospirales bacterium]